MFDNSLYVRIGTVYGIVYLGFQGSVVFDNSLSRDVARLSSYAQLYSIPSMTATQQAPARGSQQADSIPTSSDLEPFMLVRYDIS